MLTPGSLKVRLTLASVALILASVGLTVYFVLREARRGTEEIVLQSQEDAARRLAAVVSRRLVSLQRALRAAAESLPVESIDDQATMFRFIESQSVLKTMFSATFVTAADGRVIALADARGTRDPHLSFSERDYFKDTLRENRPIISRVIASRVSGEPTVIFTLPVADKSGRIAAVFGGSMRLSSRTLLDDLTQDSEDHETHIATIITDSDGQILSHPQKQWLLRKGESEPALTDAIADWKSRGRPIEPAGYSLRAGDYEVGMAGVPDADWLVFRTARADDLLGGILRGEERARWVGLGFALLGGGLTLLITFFLLQPLAQVQRRALRLLGDDAAVEGGWPEVRGEVGELSGVFQHVIRQLHASQGNSQLLLAKMHAIMAKAPVGIAFTRHRRFELVSAEFKRILGYEAVGLEGEAVRLLYASDEFYQGLGQRVSEAFAAVGVFSEEIEFVRRDGSRLWGQLQGAPVSKGDDGAGTIWTLEDVTGARQERDALSFAATHDALTGLANRREFERHLSQQLRERRQHEAGAMMFIDLDGFKAVNDSASHAAGDLLLKEVARILLERVRAEDAVARLGGDEFGILLRNCTALAAVGVAEQVLQGINAHALEWKGQRLQVGASIGVVEIDTTFADVTSVVDAADAACYAAKRSGRNAVCSHGSGILRVA